MANKVSPEALPILNAAKELCNDQNIQTHLETSFYVIRTSHQGRPKALAISEEHYLYTSTSSQLEAVDAKALAALRAIPDASKVAIISFYLPQFHAIKENNKFWGEGFTEWRQIARSIPRYPGHYQPRIPQELGFYDLSNQDTLSRQCSMAREHGISAFCYYYYWFNGKRVLEKPLDNHLQSNISMPFLIMWANENWTRAWDGGKSHVLLSQDYRDEDEDPLLADWARHLKDPRYFKLGNRPLLIIYNLASIPDARQRLSKWREKLLADHGLNPLIFVALTFGLEDPSSYGFDGAIEFPPHNYDYNSMQRLVPDAYSGSFKGRIIPYERIIEASLAKASPPCPLIKTLFPSWDNDARRPLQSLSYEGSTPQKYQFWLQQLLLRALEKPVYGHPVVAINAWNEWAEAAYLEPDIYFGRAYLNATTRALVHVAHGDPG